MRASWNLLPGLQEKEKFLTRLPSAKMLINISRPNTRMLPSSLESTGNWSFTSIPMHLTSLAQNPTGKTDQPIAYATRLLNKAEKNYTTNEKEALAMVYAVNKFRHYLLGNKFIFYVDHLALQYLVNKPQVAGQFGSVALTVPRV